MTTPQERELERARASRQRAELAGDTAAVSAIDNYILELEQGVGTEEQEQEDPSRIPYEGFGGPQLTPGERERRIAALEQQQLDLGITESEVERTGLGWLRTLARDDEYVSEVLETSRRARMIEQRNNQGGALNLTDREQQALDEIAAYERDLALPEVTGYERTQFQREYNNRWRDFTGEERQALIGERVQPGDRVVRDPETGEMRLAARSPETLAERRISERRMSDANVAVRTGTVNMVANRLQSADQEIERRKETQLIIYHQLPEEEQNRIKELFPDRAIEDISPRDFMNAVEMNPDNEEILASISGDEQWADQGRRWERMGALMMMGQGQAYMNLSPETQAEVQDIARRSEYQDIQYDEDEQRPLYPGASRDFNRYMSEVDSAHVYENLVQPYFTAEDEETGVPVLPGERLSQWVERTRQEQYSEEALINRERRFVAEGADWYNPFSWGDGETALPWENFDAFMLHVFENTPQIAVGILSARLGGRMGGGLAGWVHKGQKLSRIETMRRRVAGIGGAVAGGGTEGLLIHDAVKQQIREQLEALPNEAFEKSPYYLALIDAGLPDEVARNIFIDENARLGGKTAFVASGVLLGAPMGYVFGRAAAGRIGTSLQKEGALRTMGRIGVGAGGEALQEGTQEVSEDVITNIRLRSVDPERPIFDDVFNTFMGGALISLGPGALGSIERSDPAGLSNEDKAAMDATQDYVNASNRRYAFEASITSPSYIENTNPQQRLRDLKKLEKLQEKEAQQILANEKTMRQYIKRKQGETAKTELMMLDRLVARSHATLMDINAARSRRTTATQELENYKREQNERKEIQARVDEQVLEIQDVQRLANNIDKVQSGEALTEEEYTELKKEGWGKVTEQGEFIITPKGKRALNHLVQTYESLQNKMKAGYVGVDRRTEEGRALREQLNQMSDVELENVLYRRQITGLQNRRAFQERGQDAPAYAFADVDTLAWVNDNMGHNAGDRMLMAIGDAMQEVEKEFEGVQAFHVSGDEFVVTGESEQQVEKAMQKVRDIISNKPVRAGMDQVTPTVTWGTGQTAEEADAAMNRRADMRRQEGKRAGRKEKPVSHKDIGSKQMMLLQRERFPGKKTRMSAERLAEKKLKRIINKENPTEEQFDFLAEAIAKAKGMSKTERAAMEKDLREVLGKEVEAQVLMIGGKPTGQPWIPKKERLIADRYNTTLPAMAKAIADRHKAEQDHAGQRGLFDIENMPTQWWQVRDYVQKGDEVEILTPTGALHGTVTNVVRHKGRDRMSVVAEGIRYLFNMEGNYMMRATNMETLADEYVPEDKMNMRVGELAAEGYVYADLAAEVDRDTWYDSPIEQIDFTLTMPKNLPRASKRDMKRARLVKKLIEKNNANLPEMTLVESVEDLPDHIRDMMLEEVGGSEAALSAVRGYFDHRNPANGVYVIVPNVKRVMETRFGNLTSRQALQRGIAETLFHEVVGHYGIRGLIGDETQLRELMHSLVKSMPTARRKALGSRLGLSLNDPSKTTAWKKLTSLEQRQAMQRYDERLQLAGEEYIAYIVGQNNMEVMEITPKERTIVEKIIDFIKSIFVQRGWDRHFYGSPERLLNKVRQGHDLTDQDVADLISRAHDFIRFGHKWSFTHLTGQQDKLGPSDLLFMRDRNIFQAGMVTAINDATNTMWVYRAEGKEWYGNSKNQLKSIRASKKGGTLTQEDVALFPESMTKGQAKEAFAVAQKEGWFSKIEMKYQRMNAFIENMVYGDLATFGKENDSEHFWLKWNLPPVMEQKYTAAQAVMSQSVRDSLPTDKKMSRKEMAALMVYGDAGEHMTDQEIQSWWPDGIGPSTDLKDAATTVLDDINQKAITPKINIPKITFLNYLNSDRAVRLELRQVNARNYSLDNFDMVALATQVLGRPVIETSYDYPNWPSLNEQEKRLVEAERTRLQEQGPDIGYDQATDEWYYYPTPYIQHSSHFPNSSSMVPDTMREWIITQDGRGPLFSRDTTGHSDHATNHFSVQRPPRGVTVLHVRAALAYDQDPNAPQAFNPARQGQMYYMGELQSDWFQWLSKSFPTEQAHRQAPRTISEARQLLESRGAMVANVTIEKTKQKIAEIMARPISDNVLRDIANREGIDVADIDSNENAKLDILKRRASNIRTYVVQPLRNEVRKRIDDHLPKLGTNDMFKEDIRLHEKLDKAAARMFLRRYVEALNSMDSNLDSVSNMNQWADGDYYFKEAMGYMNNFLRNNFENVGDKSWQLRVSIPQVSKIIHEHIQHAFRVSQNDYKGLSEMMKVSDNSVTKKITIDKDAFYGYNQSNSEAFMQGMISNAVAAGLPPTVKIRAEQNADSHIEVIFTGIDTEIESAISKMGDLVSWYYTNHIIPKWQQEEESRIDNEVYAAAQAAKRRIDDVDADEVWDWTQMTVYPDFETVDTENPPREWEGISLHSPFNNYDLQNKEGYIKKRLNWEMDNEQDQWMRDNPDLFKNVKDERGKQISRRRAEYKNYLTPGDNSQAEQWLERELRKAGQRIIQQNREPGGKLYQQVYDRLAAEYDADPSSLMVGKIPAEVDADGNVTKYGPVYVFKMRPGRGWRTVIGTESMDTNTQLEDTKIRLRYQIDEYFNWYAQTAMFPLGSETLQKTGDNPFFDSSRLIKREDVPRTDEPDWAVHEDAITSRIVPDAEFGKLPTSEKLLERKIKAERQQTRGYIPADTALAQDRWRIAALKGMLSDAVRLGVRRIAWSGGLASGVRGLWTPEYLEVDELTWTQQTMKVRGEDVEVFVINGKVTPDIHGNSRDDLWDKPLILDASPSRMTATLGHEIRKVILEQAAGVRPRVSNMEEGTPKESDLLITSSVAPTGNNQYFLTMAGTNTIIESKSTKEEIEAAKAQLFADAQARGSWDTVGGLPTDAQFGGTFINSGKVTRGDIGSADPLKVIITNPDFFSHAHRRDDSYAETYEMTRPQAARLNYEGLTLQAWNGFLKQYGVQVEQGLMKVNNMDAARSDVGEQAAVFMPGDIIQQYGQPRIERVAGQADGFVLVGDQGVLINTVFPNRGEADIALQNFIQNHTNQDPNAVLVNQIEITDEMFDIYSKPVPGFHYDPYNDPILQEAAEKIGSKQQSMIERYREWRRAWKHEFHQGIFDKFYGLKYALRRAEIYDELDAENNPYMQARLTTSLDSVMKAVMEYGHPVWKEGITSTEGKGLIEILQPVLNDVETWAMYMVGVRAKRLMEEGREKLFSEEQIERMVELGDHFPHFKKVAEEYAAFNKKVLDYAQEAGIINPDTREMWEHADYVPFYRIVDERLAGPLSPRSGIANQNSPIKQLRGSEDNIGDVMHNIMMNLTNLVDASMKNHAARMAVDALKDSGIIQKKPMTMKQEMIPLDQVKRMLIERGMNPDAIPAEALSGFQKMFAIQPPTGEGVISIMRDGKKEYYYTDDMLLYRSMSSINMKQWGAWMNMFRAPKRLLTTLITLDPGFMAANFIRDTASAFVLSRDNYVPIVSAVKGFGQALVEDEAMRTMLAAGAAFESGYINQGDPNATNKMLKRAQRKPGFAKTILRSPQSLFEAYKHLGSAVENANRMAVYNAAIAAGKSKAQAVFEAKDLMDFSMGGDWPFIQFLIQTVPFMGARMQGLHRLGRGMREHPVAFTLKGTLLMMAGLALWFAFKDDERYKALEQWDKDTYFHWWIGDRHFRLPKPFEVGAIFNTIPERIMEYIYSEENDAGKLLLNRFGFMIAETFNMNPTPQTIRPLVEMYFNKNFFQDRSIVSPYEADRMAPEQYRYNTSPTFVELGRALPGGLDTASNKIRSPLHLQNLYTGYTGTLGRYLIMASDGFLRNQMGYPEPPAWRTGDYPILGRFARGTEPRRTMYEEEVYNLIRKVSEIQGSMRFLEQTEQYERMDQIEDDWVQYIDIAGDLNSIRQEVQDINREIMEVWVHPRMSPEDKRDRIDLLQQDKNDAFLEGYMLRPGARDDPQPITMDDVRYVIDEWGTDPEATARLNEQAPDTATLVEQIDTLGMRELERLVNGGQ